MEATVRIHIDLPASQEDCANWICKQSPSVAADALRLCAPAYEALQREMGREEYERLNYEYKGKINSLEREAEGLKQRHADEQRRLAQEHDDKRRDLEECLAQERAAFLADKRAAVESSLAASDVSWQQQLELLETKHDREKRLLQAEAQAANDRLASKHASEVEVRDAIRAQYEERLQAARASHEALEQRYRLEVEAKDRQLSEAWQWHREQSETFQQRLQTLQQEKESREIKHAEDLRLIVEQQSAALSRFHGTASRIGQAGEALVSDVFLTLDLGELVDRTVTRGSGNEDFLWRWTPPSSHCQELRCSVEVKNVAALHSVKDTRKHLERLHQALAAGDVNAAMFISLRAKIPNQASRLLLRTDSGVPVLYLYRTSDDSSITAEGLVELGFRFLAQVWPEWCRHSSRDTTSETAHLRTQALQAAADALSRQLEHLEVLQRQASVLTKHCDGMRKELGKLQQTRDAMWRDITQTCTAWSDVLAADDERGALEEQPEALVKDEGGVGQLPEVLPFLPMLRAFVDDKKRYPKTWSSLKLTPEQKSEVDALKRKGIALEDLRDPVMRLKRARVAE